ncbi:MAG: hypothetical protein WCK98_01730 [bacterium]
MDLLVHPRRGLFQLTKCQNCGYSFECKNCTAKLTTYRTTNYSLELVCHQCQSYYSYPIKCPECKSTDVVSKFGGIDDLAETLATKLNKNVVRLDAEKSYEKIQAAITLNEDNPDSIFVTTRVFDPAIPYSKFAKIIFIQAENLLASPDYLVQEETAKALGEIFMQVDEKSEIIFDTNTSDLEFFQNLIKLNQDYPKPESVDFWYTSFLEKELQSRQKFGFPPFVNLLLLTTQEKDLQKSLQKLAATKHYFEKSKLELPGVTWGSPYPAKFLRRKGMFSHHLLVRFPRNYEQYKTLQKIVFGLQELYKLQVRLNPRHLF